MVVDHIGYAVKDIEKARADFVRLGYAFEEIVEDPDRNVLLLFGDNDGYRIELIATLDEDQPSPVKEILRKNGPTPYHLCYRTDDLEREIQALKAERWIVVTPPKRAIAFGDGGRVAFLLKRSVGMIELVEVKP